MTESATPKTHQALQSARLGRIDGDEMLNQIADGHLAVPLAEEPVIKDGTIAVWNPAMASKSDGSQWLIVFSTEQLAAAYCMKNPGHSFCMTVESRWVIAALPENIGILFNPQGPYMLEWNAEGIAKFRNAGPGSRN